MVKIAHLPGDLLAHLLHYGDISYGVVALWKCGDKLLNTKLSEWIHTVHLEDRNPASTSRYPKMLSSLLRLRTLSINRLGSIGPPLMIAMELQKLPSSLTELMLTSYEGLLHFRDFPEHFNDEDSYEVLANQLRFWNIALKFPALRKLVVDSEMERFEEWFDLEWSPHLREILPTQLEHLELCAHFDDTHQLADYLPETLQTLHFPALPHSLSWPPHLTELSGSFTTVNSWRYSSSVPFKDVAKTFPKSLTSTTLGNGPLEELQLPPHMTSISSYSSHIPLTPSSLASLPSKLATFSIFGSTISASVLSSLPKTITRMNIAVIDLSGSRPYDCLSDDGTTTSLWPPNLRFLTASKMAAPKIPREGTLSIEKALQLLPPSLEELDIVISGSGLLTWDLNLPSLRSLTLKDSKLTYSPDCNNKSLETLTIPIDLCFSFAPCFLSSIASLTDLTFHSTYPGNKQAFNADELFTILPKNLKRLTCDFRHRHLCWSPSSWSLLPSSLELLDLMFDYDEEPKSSDILPYVPPNLTHLQLKVSTPPTVGDMTAMMCLSKLRFLRLHLPHFVLPADYDSAPIMELWPESHFFTDNLGIGWDSTSSRRMALFARSRMHPDPRVVQN